MKKWLLIVIVTFSSLLACSQKITLSLNNVPLEDALDSVFRLTHYGFAIKSKVAWTGRQVTLQADSASFLEVLKMLLRGQSVTYEIEGHFVYIIPSTLKITGKVITTSGEPVPYATIIAKSSGINTRANEEGEFSVTGIEQNEPLEFSSVGFSPKTVRIKPHTTKITVVLPIRSAQLEDVEITSVINTGYQFYPREKAVGSFTRVTDKQFGRSASVSVTERLEGMTSGVLHNANHESHPNRPALTIRGVSTLSANREPLVVVDNFPYEGDIININPNDIESITIAKDAAASSIWGAFSGNGVIVITTRKGKYNQDLKVSAISSIALKAKPDVYYQPAMPAASFIALEESLFNFGAYDERLKSPSYAPVSPVIELLDKQRRGLVTGSEMEEQLHYLSGLDNRKDLHKYFYRYATSFQQNISFSAGNKIGHHYLSLGLDNTEGSLAGNKRKRFLLSSNNTFRLMRSSLEASINIALANSRINDGSAGLPLTVFPYQRLVDAKGQPASVVGNLRQSFIDTAGAGKLLDWNYRPLEELLLADKASTSLDYRLDLGLTYKLIEPLRISVKYQLNKGGIEQGDIKSPATYYTRNLVNQFTQVNEGGYTESAIPGGNIVDSNLYSYTAYNARAQLNYERLWNDKHEINAIAGAEVRAFTTSYVAFRRYGYNKQDETHQPVDYNMEYPLYYAPFYLGKIPENQVYVGTTDHYRTVFAHMFYGFKQRYFFSASLRRDQSNLFGFETNRKGAPIWSVGAGWDITRQYTIAGLSYLRVRATFGTVSNIDKTLSAFTTARTSAAFNPFYAPYTYIVSLADKSLRWEKTKMVNMAMEFTTANKTISGIMEYYIKNGTDLIGPAALDPTTGSTMQRRNAAAMWSNGVDITLNTTVSKRSLGWKNSLLLSYNNNIITRYGSVESLWAYVNEQLVNPLEGFPLYSIYSFRWAGLNERGEPIGYLNGQQSTDYFAIMNASDFSGIVYHGSATPIVYGSLLNTFTWKQWELSCLVTAKLGYYFRRNSINYTELMQGSSAGHPDYLYRWQKPGDEQHTNVPSLVYPIDQTRDYFYTHSEVLVEKGDHIRLRDIYLRYTFNNQAREKKKTPVTCLTLYANNLGIIWKATRTSLDPDYVTGDMPEPFSLGASIKIDF